MGRIADQKMEHLAPSDKGIILYRKELRKLCRDLEKGIKPDHTSRYWGNSVPTYGGDTVLNIPVDAENDNRRLREIGDRVMEIQFDAELMVGQARDGL